jgi:O-antigen ligase
MALAVAVIFPVYLASPYGKEVLDALTFSNATAAITEDSVAYRQRLVQVAIQIVLQNPFFGAYNYIYSSALQELKQGEGIIDIVNSYVAIALASGLVGLSLFTGFFIAVLTGIFRSMRRLTDRTGELYELGRVLFSVLVCIMIIIATVSSIEVIPVIYWSVAGLGAAYVRMLAPVLAGRNADVTGAVPAAMPVSAQQSGSFRPLGTGLG